MGTTIASFQDDGKVAVLRDTIEKGGEVGDRIGVDILEHDIVYLSMPGAVFFVVILMEWDTSFSVMGIL